MTDKEIHLIKKYSVLPRSSVAAVAAGMLAFFFAIPLSMIYSIVFHAEEGLYVQGMIFGFVLLVLGLLLYLYGFLGTALGERGKRWAEIERKSQIRFERDAELAAQVANVRMENQLSEMMRKSDNDVIHELGNMHTIDTAIDSSFAMLAVAMQLERRARRVAAVWGIEIPAMKKVFIGIFVIPVISMILFFVPGFVSARKAAVNNANAAAETIQMVEDSMADCCEMRFGEDPQKSYHKSYYTVTCSKDMEGTSSVTVNVETEGYIDGVCYQYHIDTALSTEENVNLAKEQFAIFRNILYENFGTENTAYSNIFGPTDVFDEMPFEGSSAQTFISEFTNGTYYEEIDEWERFDEQMRIHYSFVTDSEEEWDEYSNPYIIFSIEE